MAKDAENILATEILPAEKNNYMENMDKSGIARSNGKRITTLRKCLGKFDEALVRLNQGTYGICERCGQPICLGRLEAVPFANLCTSCKNLKNLSAENI
jgi:RNA polymerase-binding protein DksA